MSLEVLTQPCRVSGLGHCPGVLGAGTVGSLPGRPGRGNMASSGSTVSASFQLRVCVSMNNAILS